MSLDISRVRRALPQHRIDYHDSLPSTQPLATKLAETGVPSGTAVVAGEQTAGIGRQGHSWHSPPNSGLYVSLVLYPPIEPATRPVLTLALGLAVAEAIGRVAGIQCDLRWPNDVMIDQRKAAGILVQLAGNAAVAGIGVNVNHEGFPADIADVATSIRIATGQRYDRADLLIALLESANAFSKMLNEAGKGAILAAFTRASSYAKGKRVLVDMGDRQISGLTAGLDDYGFLRVLKPDGTVETVLAGGVRPGMSDPDLSYNYFNYYTEIEEHFQRVRGTSIFLLSPLDWAILESWKAADVPLEAVLRGIDLAFEKWRAKPKKTQMVNSIAFCAQAVLTEAQRMSGTDQPRPEKSEAPPFEHGQVQEFIGANAAALRKAGFDEAAASLEHLCRGPLDDLEDLEQRLGVIEQKLIATLRSRQSEEDALAARKSLDSHLRPYRGKMTADQLSMLERQYLDRNLLEKVTVPRLSLFYL